MRFTSFILIASIVTACDASASPRRPVQMRGTSIATEPVRAFRSALTDGTPWQAELYTGHIYEGAESKGRQQWDNAHRCGASYIKEHWVLTAAHCFYKNNPKGSQEPIDWQTNKWRVRLGARDLASGEGVSFPVDRVEIYPGFVHSTYTNDVALVHFVADAQSHAEADRANPGKHVAKIRVNGAAAADAPVRIGEAVTVSGWGKTEDVEGANTPTDLQWVTIHAVDCNWGGVYKGQTTAENICAFGLGKDACQGDSGGPLVRAGGEPVLVGIVSWGVQCGVNAGVYVRIDRQHYYDWIDKTVGGLPPTGP
jgi:trypsin